MARMIEVEVRMDHLGSGPQFNMDTDYRVIDEQFGKKTKERITLLGGCMDTSTEEVRQLNMEFLKLKKMMESTYNEIITVGNAIDDKLTKQIRDIRETRMAIEMEGKSLLTMMKDIRKFFLEDDYEQEVKRLHEFVGVCKALKDMQESGAFEVVIDAMLKLAVGQAPKETPMIHTPLRDKIYYGHLEEPVVVTAQPRTKTDTATGRQYEKRMHIRAQEMKDMYKKGATITELCKFFGVGRSTVYCELTGKNYRELRKLKKLQQEGLYEQVQR